MLNLLTEDKYYRRFLFGMVLAGGSSFLLIFLLVWTGPLRSIWPNPGYIPGRDFKLIYDIVLSFSSGQGIPTSFYFPLTLFFYLPLNHLSFYHAFIVMTVWNLSMALILAIVAVKIVKYYGVNLSSGAMWILFLSYIFFCPATAELNSANINTMVACFIALFYYFLFIKQRNMLAALCLVVATLFKIYPAFLIIVALMDRRYKFIWAFLLILCLCVIASILLLGIPVHIIWVEFLLQFQGGLGLMWGGGATITGILYKSLQLIGVTEVVSSTTISVIWIAVRAMIVIALACYLFIILRKKDSPNYNQWIILSFSLFSVLMVSLPNHAWVYYATCLALPFILCIFCLKLSLFDRILLALSIAFFSFNTHIDNLAGFVGGAFGGFFHILSPGAIGNLLFLSFILVYMTKLKRGGVVDAIINRNSCL